MKKWKEFHTEVYIYVVLLFTFYTSGFIYNFVFWDLNWTIKIIQILLIAGGFIVFEKEDFEKITFFVIGEFCLGIWALLGNAEITTYLKFVLRLTFLYCFYLYGRKKNICLSAYIYRLCVAIAVMYFAAWLLFDMGPFSNLGKLIDVVIEIKEGEIRRWQYTDFLHIYYRWKNERRILGFTIMASNGPFWEPGLYQIYLNFALYYELFRKKTNRKTAGFLICAVLTTTSTTGIFLLIIILTGWLFSRCGKKMRKILAVPLGLGGLGMILFVWIEKTTYSAGNVSARLSDLLILLEKIAAHPITGNGMGNQGAFNALFLYLADFGILALIGIAIFCHRIMRHKGDFISKLVLIAWLALSLMNEPVGYHSLFCLILILLYTGETENSLTTESLRAFLERHPRINLLQYIVRKKMYSKDLCREMLEQEKSPYTVTFHHYGTRNEKKPIYHIVIGREYQIMGYCSLLRVTLLHIAYAKRMGFLPVVDWKPELLYSETEAVNGTKNSFAYFFETTGGVSLEQLMESDLVILSKTYDTRLFAGKLSYYPSEYEMRVLAEAIKEELHFNRYGREEIVSPCEQILQKGKILGVHIRGTDFREQFSRHPVLVPKEAYRKAIRKAVSEAGYDYIFLATDEEETIREFQAEFGNRLLYYEALRSVDGTPLHYGRQERRERHKYLLGREMLKDLYMLGRCDGLVAGLSNVSVMARAIKRSRGESYDDLKIMDEGLYENKKESSFYISNGNSLFNRFKKLMERKQN